MNSERTSLEARAARHAALADPTRLRIVDLLTLGDLSPQELQVRLEVASNLLAHHLKALEAASLIRRSRSEGDRRRSYVHLNADDLRDLGTPAHFAASRVLFVCTANSARSQLAEHIWRENSSIPAASAGTVPARSVAPGAVEVAAKHGFDLSPARPRLLSEIEQAEGELRITVCDNAHEDLGASDLHWSVPDPVAVGSLTAFEAAYVDLRRRIDTLAPRVSAA
ncbi:helix-turn-helix domain-containing protein [Microbacterium sp. P07]|uniref:arsenate reductase/protein-tyrosine-phosphatase family protein n=1 Tax=Microbacterium sp. P07 TaxID=3366952 RepID=UPI003746C7A6